ncbi:MAG: hypothetical protein ACRDT0_14850 [Pseudonocardiaceae bacterium]
MTTPPEIARKVRQLDNDVQAVYEMLAGISATQHRQGNRLEEIAAGQAELATAQAQLAASQAQLAASQAELAASQAELAATQAELAATQAEHGTKLDTILELMRSDPPADGR